MGNKRKNPDADLREYYTIFLEIGLIAALVVFIAAVKIDFRQQVVEFDAMEEQDIVEMEDIVQTEQIEKPPPPPRPPVPVEVPNDEIMEDVALDLNFELDLDAPIDLPPPPPEQEDTEDFFIVVEQMPEIVGGFAALQRCVQYPVAAQRAGIEGTVYVQFIVNEQGNVESPTVLRSVGAGTDEEAIRCVREAQFTPGRQRGAPVRVRFNVPVIFRLTQR